MDFINKQDDILLPFHLFEEPFDPALKLAAELSSCHEGGQVQKMDLLVGEFCRDIAGGNALCQSLGDSGLTDTGLTDETGVVLGTAAENLDGTLNFAVSSDDTVEFPFSGTLCEVCTVEVQEAALFAISFLASFSRTMSMRVVILLRIRDRRVF